MVYLKPEMRLLGAVALSAALSLTHRPAYGQSAVGTGAAPSPAGFRLADSEAERTDDAATIVVTGTRITSLGFTAPTPTTTLNAEDLQKSAEPNIFSAITQLPSLMGSSGTATGTNRGPLVIRARSDGRKCREL